MTIQRFLLFFLLSLVSCSLRNDNGNTDSKETAIDSTTRKSYSNPTITNSDTLTIDQKSAVFYLPDSNRIEKRKKEIGEEDFNIGADDYLYSMHISHSYLESLNLATFYTRDHKYLKFIRSDKSYSLIRVDTLPELWGLYFFDPKKGYKQVDLNFTEEEYQLFFN